MSWPATEEDMQEIWRKRTKNDMLSIMLADPEKPWEDAAETLRKRYTSFLKRIN